MPRSELEFPQVDDSEFASQAELDGVKDNNEAPAQFDAATMNNWELWKRINNAENRANDSNPVFFNPSGNDYIEVTATGYEVRANIVYRGTDIWTPNTLIVMVSRSNAAGTGYFRVYDYNNDQEICERTFANVVKVTYTFTLTAPEIALFQAGTVALEFQLRKSGGGAGKIQLHAAGLYSI